MRCSMTAALCAYFLSPVSRYASPRFSSPSTRCLCHIQDRKSTRLNSSHSQISYAVFCLKKKIGAIVKPGAPPEDKGPTRFTRPYMGSGYVLVVPARSTKIRQLEDVKDGKIGVEHTSRPHYILSQRAIPTASFGSQLDILDAVASDTVAAGFATGPYVGWYLKQHPGSVRAVDTASPDPEFRWNVAVRLLNTDQALVDALNRLIGDLLSAGTITKILESYGIPYV